MYSKFIYLCTVIAILIVSCRVVERASVHGLNNGTYSLDSGGRSENEVYVDLNDKEIDLYRIHDGIADLTPFKKFPLVADSQFSQKLVLKKQGLDIDITSVLMKYRPSVSGLPAQLSTDLNLALYAGWRRDLFTLENTQSPIGKYRCKISNRGYDVGVFAGPGATLISPFTTRGTRADEYNGMVIQAGLAGFLETNVASFGLAVGFDHLLSPDRNVWIYNRKPWVGFVVGVALN
jgi:hypothetical protein